jgi:hypothetical protein
LFTTSGFQVGSKKKGRGREDSFAKAANLDSRPALVRRSIGGNQTPNAGAAAAHGASLKREFVLVLVAGRFFLVPEDTFEPCEFFLVEEVTATVYERPEELLHVVVPRNPTDL